MITIAQIKNRIIETIKGSHLIEAEGDIFFFDTPDNKFPFATVITKDNEFDKVSNLDRADTYRLNVSIGKANFNSMFGAVKSTSGIGGYVESGVDFTQTDKIMPHPMYGNMYWICILNPGEEHNKTVLSMLFEAIREKREKIEDRAMEGL